MAAPTVLTYPTPPTADQVDDYHGTLIADPYRPLEDSDAPETRAWIAAENELTASVLDRPPARRAIRARLAELWDYPRAGAPWRRGDRWFQLRNTGLQDQDVLWTAEAPEADGSVLIDPNDLSGEGTTALPRSRCPRAASSSRSRHERRRLGLADAGGSARVATGEELPDRVAWSKFASAAWTHDDAGFFYGRYPEPPADAAYDAPNRDMELRYHRLGTDPADDRLVFATPHEPEWGFEPEVSDDGRLLVVSVWRGTDPENRIYVADLASGVEAAVVRPLLDAADAQLRAHRHDRRDALPAHRPRRAARPRHRRRRRRPGRRARGHRREATTRSSTSASSATGSRASTSTTPSTGSRSSSSTAATSADVRLPGIGTIVDLAGRRDDDELFLTFTTFAAPPIVLAVRMADGAVREVAAAGARLGPGRLRQRAGLRRPRTTARGCRCS